MKALVFFTFAAALTGYALGRARRLGAEPIKLKLRAADLVAALRTEDYRSARIQ